MHLSLLDPQLILHITQPVDGDVPRVVTEVAPALRPTLRTLGADVRRQRVRKEGMTR